MKRECETCIKRKTPYCPTSMECMATDDMLLRDNYLLNEEVKQLKEVIDKAIELTKNLLKTEDRGYYQIIFKEILKSLGDIEI